MKPSTKISTSILVALILYFAGWISMYPPGDPKNMRYVLWKAGLCNMNLNLAAGTMIGDINRDKLVIGKTEAELRHRFGYLLAPADASPYLKICSEPWKDKKLLFIRNTPWMVVFEGDRATNLVLIKGC